MTPDTDMAVPAETISVVTSMIDAQDAVGLAAFIDLLEPADATLVVSRLEPTKRAELLSLLDAKRGAQLAAVLPESQAVEALSAIPPQVAAPLLRALPSDTRADLLGSLDHESAIAVLDALTTDEAEAVRTLTEYEHDCAGGLMVIEYLSYHAALTVQDVVDDLEKNADRYARFDVQYMYVVDRAGVLRGVLRIRDLLLTDHSRSLRTVMLTPPLSVRVTAKLPELVAFFEKRSFVGVPVVDEKGRLVGVVKRSAIQAARAQDNEKMYRLAQGIIGGEELRTMPLRVRSRRRLSWLSINVVLNLIAASVIAAHQETLEAAIALAVFLPIISDMSGASGAQAVAVSTRELLLGVTRPTEVWRAVWGEAWLGIVNGAALGVIIGGVATLWQGSLWLGVVVGTALGLNTLLSVCIGAATPLLLKRVEIDPALASGPILTTITDVCGFFIVLSLASLAIERITG